MKTQILALLAIALTANSCGNGKNDSVSFGPFGKSIEGKGPIREKTYPGNFDEIKVSQSIQAEVIKSDVEKVVISAPSDILDEILVDNVAGKIHIHFKPSLNISAQKVSAKIYAKDFSKIEASSSANILVKNKFTQDRTDIEVSSSANIEGNFEANNMEVDVSSSGNFTGKIWAVDLSAEVTSSGEINLSGEAKNAEMDASSSGTLNARNLVAENADLQASSGGNVSLSVSRQLTASASSSGDIAVSKKGNLNVISQKESSGGSILVQ
ncbi:head GIN domain-containing protein [Chryseobacterium sp.]|uniref:head GIN domain-containing protein n=1 Tax=Chryseobacterium sp. TaxID=1871047 RepID=UPI0011CA4C68|nr:head GIN domain-containing protein [Chryseobacterium sp.]TXF77427.1 DUF2807 domain-containing protein [Chryseobacterium sp.]